MSTQITKADRIEQTYTRGAGWKTFLLPCTVFHLLTHRAAMYRDVERVRITGKGDFLVTEFEGIDLAPTPDDLMGMTWFNGMTRVERITVLNEATRVIGHDASIEEAWQQWKAGAIRMDGKRAA